MTWIDRAHLVSIWPQAGDASPITLERHGSGLRLRGPQGAFYLKRRASPQRLESEIRVLCHLHGKGLPAIEPVPTASGAPYAVENDAAYFLYRALPGEPYMSFDGHEGIGRAARLGDVLGRLHTSLARFPNVEGLPRYTFDPHLIDRLEAAGSALDNSRAPNRVVRAFGPPALSAHPP